MTSRAATGIGFIAVLLWSTLALFTSLSGQVPPFQLVSMSFAIAGLVGIAYLATTRTNLSAFRDIPAGAWALGVGGLFGYHFFYFLALRSAPAVEANLINYLWPLLIVLFSALIKDDRSKRGLRWWHVTGALLGLGGTILIVTDGNLSGRGEAAAHLLGYAAALGAALTWSSYSVANRRFARIPSTSVAGFCVVTALLAAIAHLAFEQTVWPVGPVEWAATLGLGLGPVGAAFYVWDNGTKHGDIRVLGAVAYAIPLMSTLLLVAFGISKASPSLWLACFLITGGAVLAARELLFKQTR